MSQQLRRRLGRRVLEGDRPARLAADDAQRPLQAEVVDLDHEAVDLVVEALAPVLPELDVLDDGVEVVEALDVAG